jgi:hypothetical protein
MPLFRPNNKCQVQHTTGFNEYGEEVLQTAATVPCTFLQLRESTAPTPLGNESASHGAVKEIVASSRILFPAIVDIRMGDKVTAAGLELRVYSINKKFDIKGRLDHQEVELVAWGDK